MTIQIKSRLAIVKDDDGDDDDDDDDDYNDDYVEDEYEWIW